MVAEPFELVDRSRFASAVAAMGLVVVTMRAMPGAVFKLDTLQWLLYSE